MTANNLTYSSESTEFFDFCFDEKFGLLRIFQCIIQYLLVTMFCITVAFHIVSNMKIYKNY